MSTAELRRAVATLERGGLVAFPTETVYGLGADATSDAALARLYQVKARPLDHPVIVHLANVAQLDDVAVDLSDEARALAAQCWPGPLTLVVRRRAGVVSPRATGGRDTVGVRIPDHHVAREVLSAFGRAVAAPSANRFGKVSPTTAAHVRDDLGDDVDLVLDGGACRVGVESTIVDCSGPGSVRILRLGGVAIDTIESVTAQRAELAIRGEVAAPGTLDAHYAPRARIRAVDPDSDPDLSPSRVASLRVGVLALASVAVDVTGVTVLTPPRDVDDFARVLYARFREADRLGLDELVVVLPEPGGLADAIRDRVERASCR